MRSLLFFALVLLISAAASSETRAQPASNGPTVIVVVGAGGEEEFGKSFEKSAALWIDACAKGGARSIVIGTTPTNGTPDLEQLKQAIASVPKESIEELWLVLLGHGTFDGQDAKFNLRGPDLTATDLAAWLAPFKRPLAVIDCASSSGPFLGKLSSPGRVVITATRSGYEQNYARFGEYLSEAIASPAADLDKDGQTSLLEAFLMASRRVAEFYESEGRLATEHALLDDNGDSLGTPAEWFRGIHATKQAKDGAKLDGFRAHQFCLVRNEQEQKESPALRARRDELELAVARLRETKGKLDEDEYYRQLEKLVLELAKLADEPLPSH
ncbi:MAG: hypothetical protein JWR26_3725 [Pedosphaera sp.]|nr:hypothetical protein [Pedosphaera sp.]